MTATAHALVGGAIAATVSNPVLGITLATISHPLLDMIPHWDFGWGWRKKTKVQLFTEASSDLLFGVVVSYLIFGWQTHMWYFLACVFAAVVWDLAEVPYWFFNWRFAPFSWIYKIQSVMQGKTKTMMEGIIMQIVSLLVIFFMLYAIPRA